MSLPQLKISHKAYLTQRSKKKTTLNYVLFTKDMLHVVKLVF